MRIPALLSRHLAALALPFALLPAAEFNFDLVVYGGNAAGVAAAVQASRMGAGVVLLEPGPALGGTHHRRPRRHRRGGQADGRRTGA